MARCDSQSSSCHVDRHRVGKPRVVDVKSREQKRCDLNCNAEVIVPVVDSLCMIFDNFKLPFLFLEDKSTMVFSFLPKAKQGNGGAGILTQVIQNCVISYS